MVGRADRCHIWLTPLNLSCFLFNAFCELCLEGGAEGGDGGFAEGLTVGLRVVSQPQFHQMHKNMVLGEERGVQMPCLILPLIAELAAHFFKEHGELVEFVLGLLLAEQVETGVVVHMLL